MNIPEVSAAARAENPSTHLPQDFQRPQTAAGLPVRQRADVFDKNRLPADVQQNPTEYSEPVVENTFDALGFTTERYVPRHSVDLEDMAVTGKNPEAAVKMIPHLKGILGIGGVLLRNRGSGYTGSHRKPN